ncbi:MAG: hypothetical protein KJ864_07110 [Candidatus Omnitrophica bacterium]|nr:hypothetical protein [Candidatus Omnitrophota bacterium]MBU1895116.1 hypothetical protein [Candidatus Omnitrophota bacterium]
MKIGKKITLMCLSFFYLYNTVIQMEVFADEKVKPEWVPEISAETSFETKYIWRGQTLVDNAVIQPGASLGFNGFKFSVWGNYDAGLLDRLTEWDYTFDYTLNVGTVKDELNVDIGIPEIFDPMEISLGYILYTFPNLSGNAFDSQEIYAGFSYTAFGLTPMVKYYCDFDSGSGSYWEFGGSYFAELAKDINAGISTVAGYNAGQWGYDRSFSNLLFSGDIAVTVLKYFVLSPNVNYSLALDKQYSSEFYGGIKVSIEY